MTQETRRSMPGPPDCTCIGRGNGCLTCLDTIGYDLEAICPGCPVHAGPSYLETKRLTAAECAAEYWRAEADSLYSHPDVGSWSARPVDIVSRGHIWDRFVTRSHELEEA